MLNFNFLYLRAEAIADLCSHKEFFLIIKGLSSFRTEFDYETPCISDSMTVYKKLWKIWLIYIRLNANLSFIPTNLDRCEIRLSSRHHFSSRNIRNRCDSQAASHRKQLIILINIARMKIYIYSQVSSSNVLGKCVGILTQVGARQIS